MKSTVKVSIGRLAFHLDSDAHNVLKTYLDRLEKHFAGKESGKEIVSDIEGRLAELLSARLTQAGQVVTRPIVDEVIAIMGMPDDMEDETATASPSGPELRPPVAFHRKRLYRDIDYKVIGGVCSGLANYFGIDAVFVRLFFVLFFFSFFFWHGLAGTAMLTYLILWVVVPAARTDNEKLKMRGNANPTVAEIERKMLEDAYRPAESSFLRLLKFFGRAMLVFFGIIILIVALVGFLFVPWSLCMFDFIPHIPTIDLLNYVNISAPLWVLKLLLGAVFLLPLLGLIYLGVKALVGFKGKYKVGLIMFLLWLVSLISLALLVIPTISSHAQWTNLQEDVVVESPCDTLYVNLPEQYRHMGNNMLVNYNHEEGFLAFWTGDSARNTVFYLLPAVDILHTSDTGNIRISYTRHASGRNELEARARVAAMPSKFLLQDSLLLLEPFIFDKKNNKWDGEMAAIKIYVPQNKRIQLLLLNGDSVYTKKTFHWHLRDYKYEWNVFNWDDVDFD